jgi:hypothetical protein
MSCHHSRNERFLGEVDDDLLQLVKAACVCVPLQVRVRVCIPPMEVRLPYMQARLTSQAIGTDTLMFLGYN